MSINRELLEFRVFDTDTWGALIQISIDESKRLMTIIKRNKGLTKVDKQNLYEINEWFRMFLESSDIQITDSKDWPIYENKTPTFKTIYDSEGNPHEVLLTKKTITTPFTTEEYIISEDDKVFSYSSEEYEICTRKMSSNIMSNVTFSVNWISETTNSLRDKELLNNFN